MFVNGEKIIKVLESIAPPHLAEDWDNQGLLVGSASREVSKLLIALEINEAVVDEAISKSADMIVTHHPLIFRAMKKVSDADPIGKLILKLVKHGIAVYSAHTNLDSAAGGINDYLAMRFNLKNVKSMSPGSEDALYKIVVFTPSDQTDDIRKVMSDQGAGHIGNYSGCAFVSKGQGVFKPLQGANPYIGTVDELERVNEDRLEMIVPAGKKDVVLEAMIKAHPYEEPAYDVFKLSYGLEQPGLGRVGELASPVDMKAFLLEVKSILGLDEIRFSGDTKGVVRKIALCSGAGADFIGLAKKIGVDLYLTGDLKHHDYRDAELLGVNVADMGHYTSENIYMEVLKNKLDAEFEQKDYDVRVVLSEGLKAPFVAY